MSSPRKKPHVPDEPSIKDAPVSTPPASAAPLPPTAEDTPPPPDIEKTQSPAEQVAKNSIRERLREMEAAEALSREAVTRQPPPMATEPQPPIDPLEALLTTIPEPTRNWLRAHQEYLTDAEKNAALQHFHWVAKRETGEEHTPRYIESLERHLHGGNGRVSRQSDAPFVPSPPPRQEAPQPSRQQPRHSGAPVSAPPTRQAPSMSTGRPVNSDNMKLTEEEAQLATSLGLTLEQYAIEKKNKMLQLKTEGVIVDGR